MREKGGKGEEGGIGMEGAKAMGAEGRRGGDEGGARQGRGE